jgi:hypothetical protein
MLRHHGDATSPGGTMTSVELEPIWFNPPKFWAATKDMSPQQVDSLMETLLFLAEIRNLEALRKFDFIGIGHSYLRSHRAKATSEGA